MSIVILLFATRYLVFIIIGLGGINMVNMDYLYFGLGYENHAKGQLMRLGYEAFKMEADFGFDLLVSNQARRTFKNITSGQFFVFQVKAGRVHKWEFNKREAGDRKIGEVSFFLSKTHLNYLIKEPKAFLLCYIVDGSDHDNVVGYFWLNNTHLNYLFNGQNPRYHSSKWKWFHINNHDNLFLKAKITLEAKLNDQYQQALNLLRENVNILLVKNSKEYRAFNSVQNRFEKLILKSDITNNNSSSRIELVATTDKSGVFGSKITLNPELLKLSQFETLDLNHPFS